MDNATQNDIYFRRARKVLTRTSKFIVDRPSDAILATFLKNVEAYGYTFNSSAISSMQHGMDLGDFIRFAKSYTAMLQKAVGANVEHKPMYPNFPAQVMEASNVELYLNSIMHYIGDALNVRIMPVYEKDEREPLKAPKKLEIISLGDWDDFESIFEQLLGAKIAYSPADVSDVELFILGTPVGTLEYFECDYPNRENLATLASIAHQVDNEYFEFFLSKASTATDVLRIAAALSGSTVTLAYDVRFKNFNKVTRREFLNKLQSLIKYGSKDRVIEDMLRNKALWKTLGEKLHPGEYAKRYPDVFDAFTVLRENQPFETFASKVEKAILAKNVVAAVELLATRPGELARRLDQLLRIGKSESVVINAFNDNAYLVSTNVLWQVRNHFAHRNDAKDANSVRAFFPKGNTSKIQGIPDTLTPISEKFTYRVVGICEDALQEIYSEKSKLGKVFINPELGRFAVPASARDASASLNVLGRGSRVPIGADDIIRFFIWWKDGEDRTDLDLSAMLLGDDFTYKGDLSYYNLRGYGGAHSGDITSAPAGASEFIDVSVEELKKYGVRYVAMVVNSYTNQHFVDLPECFAGVMKRNSAGSGEIYEPRTVENKFDLTADTKIAIPIIIDVETGEFIWVDLALKSSPTVSNNVVNNSSNLELIVKAMVGLHTTSLFDLFLSHAEARGTLVASEEEADTVFTIVDGRPNVTHTAILSEYL